MSLNILRPLWIKTLFLFFFCANVVWAGVGFVNSNIWLSDDNLLAGQDVKIYSVIVNDNIRGIDGFLRFFDNGEAISDHLYFDLGPDGTSQVLSVVWNALPGNHQFKAELTNLRYTDDVGGAVPEDSFVSQTTEIIFVDSDNDGDGIPNQEEIDKGLDPNKKDSDGDGEDDGVDPNPSDSTVFNGPDADKDGISDAVDSDNDNDGFFYWEEAELGTSDHKFDTDGDGVGDAEDVYPLDGSKWEAVQEVAEEVIQEIATTSPNKVMDDNSEEDKDAEDEEGEMIELDEQVKNATTSRATSTDIGANEDQAENKNRDDDSFWGGTDKDFKSFMNFTKVFLIGFLIINLLIVLRMIRDRRRNKMNKDE